MESGWVVEYLPRIKCWIGSLVLQSSNIVKVKCRYPIRLQHQALLGWDQRQKCSKKKLFKLKFFKFSAHSKCQRSCEDAVSEIWGIGVSLPGRPLTTQRLTWIGSGSSKALGHPDCGHVWRSSSTLQGGKRKIQTSRDRAPQTVSHAPFPRLLHHVCLQSLCAWWCHCVLPSSPGQPAPPEMAMQSLNPGAPSAPTHTPDLHCEEMQTERGVKGWECYPGPRGRRAQQWASGTKGGVDLMSEGTPEDR